MLNMELATLLTHLRKSGVKLWAEGEKLRYSGAKHVLTPQLIKQMKLSKAELLAHLSKTGSHKVIPRVLGEPELPLSPEQKSPWFLDQMLGGNPCDHLARAYRLNGPLNVLALERGINAIIERHGILRTVFNKVNGQAYQQILKHQELKIAQSDLRDVDPATREIAAQNICTQETARAFNLRRWPLIWCRVLRLADDEWILVMVMHHIIFDGQSFDLMFNELGQFYEEFIGGTKAQLSALPIQYADFAVWQQQKVESDSIADQIAYWQDQFNDGAAILELPKDKPRRAVQSSRGAKRALIIPAALCEQLKRLGSDERATLFMVVLAAFNTLLHRYTGQEKIVVGTPVSMRNRSELNLVIGLLVNTLALPTAISGSLSFRELLRGVRKTVINGFTHPDVPFEQLVNLVHPNRDLSYNPLFQVMLQISSLPTLRIAGLTTKPFEFATGNSQYDLSFHLYETDGGLEGYIEYDTDLFTADRIDRMAGHFETLLHGAIATPDCALAKLPLLTDNEQQQQLVAWNDTSFSISASETIHGLFEARVGLKPDAIAVRDGGFSVTFSELNKRSNRLANHLISKGAGPNKVVGICVTRSADALAGLLGILKSGSAYLPLDPSYPVNRLKFMLEDSKAALLVIEEKLLNLLPELRVPKILLGFDDAPQPPRSDLNPSVQLPTNAPAYIIYTSGSTGIPKGVSGLHRGTINRCHWMWEAYPFDVGEVCVQKTALSFVDHVWEVFGPLLKGVPLSVIRDEVLQEPARFVECLHQEKITRLVLVPSLLRAVLDLDVELGNRLSELKICITSGEVLPIDLAERCLAALPEVKLLNLYGSSEVAGDVTAHEVTSIDLTTGNIPIGRPIFNTKLYVLDSKQQPLPVGISGELYVGGVQLADGYLHRPELTKSHFIKNPFDNSGNSKLYRTGDLACYQADGILNYFGRSDQQIKVRGYRIELAEIEYILTQHSAVRETIVTTRENVPGDKRIVAYYIPTQQTPVSVISLSNFLREKLPAYMLPAKFIRVESWPMTPSNKVDRAALTVIDRGVYASRSYTKPQSELEKDIAAIWQELLQINKVSVDDNFFDLGGHSLLLVKLQSHLALLVNKELPLIEIFRYPTVRMLAKYFSDTTENISPVISHVKKRVQRQKRSLAKLKRAAVLRKGSV